MNQQVSGCPAVSVVMPVYNGEKFLSEAIDSILNQSLTDFEFIIVNDGSTDDTSKILHCYSDERIHLIERENRGFAASLNEAILVSCGKYIARMDSDDIALEGRLQLQYDFMESHPEVEILGGQAFVIDESGQIDGGIRKPTSWENISKYLTYACPLIHPTYFVRRIVYQGEEVYRAIPPVEDYDFLLRSFEKGYVMVNLPERILKYRKISTGMSSNNPQRTLVFTAKVKKLHKLRTTTQEKEDEILSYLASYKKQTSLWFKLVYNFRNQLLETRKNHRGVSKSCISLLAFSVSFLHYQIFLNTYNGFRSLSWNQ